MTKHGNSPYTIEYLDSVVEEDIPRLPKSIRVIIKRAIEERLSIDPIGLGKPLRYSLKGHRRLRVGDYRIVYRIDHTKHIVTIVVIKHRKDVYDE
ncbi:MAG: addiction module antitoxin RelB [Deltaproteobacteria bacterium RIFCSPLOWO2_02_FULL_44_10]|nr:MAG: addiction module antitoxin RelB [Deltaproteobacteria bacterium RIFCSPHIGHO2_02_FULL_44_16]OGQ46495.1 MAG: addiction module antitoxin RelB [Deltaproteobacteria bacterium RIFCSPLOWO2_02_FULL_44_10]